jgi:hypothetical protein
VGRRLAERFIHTVPGDPDRDGAATLESLRRVMPGEGVAEVWVEDIGGRLADGAKVKKRKES